MVEDLFWGDAVIAVVTATLGVIALAAGVTGYMRNHLNVSLRVALFVAAILLLAPNVGGQTIGLVVNIVGAVLFAGIAMLNKPASNGDMATEG